MTVAAMSLSKKNHLFGFYIRTWDFSHMLLFAFHFGAYLLHCLLSIYLDLFYSVGGTWRVLYAVESVVYWLCWHRRRHCCCCWCCVPHIVMWIKRFAVKIKFLRTQTRAPLYKPTSIILIRKKAHCFLNRHVLLPVNTNIETAVRSSVCRKPDNRIMPVRIEKKCERLRGWVQVTVKMSKTNLTKPLHEQF